MVDHDELPYLNRFSWFRDKDGYVVANVHFSKDVGGGQQRVSLSKVINKTPDGFVTDHENGNIGDYTKRNLRTATNSQNQANVGKRKGKATSRFKGVRWHSASKKWHAYIKVDYKQINLGLFVSETDAALAYNLAAKKHFGEFACLNDVGTSTLSSEGQKSVSSAERSTKRWQNETVFE